MNRSRKNIVSTGVYDVVYHEPGKSSADSMPLGGFDTGCNVWVENGCVMIYLAQSGAFDENGQLLKAGRIRIYPGNGFFDTCFLQQLHLHDGYISIKGDGEIRLWVESSRPVLHVEVEKEVESEMWIRYEVWRQDEIIQEDGKILFYHQNGYCSLLDEKLEQQGISHLKSYFPDAQSNRISGGILYAPGMKTGESCEGRYLDNDYSGWSLLTTKPEKHLQLYVVLRTEQETREQYCEKLNLMLGDAKEDKESFNRTKQWWHDFWEKSYVEVPGNETEKSPYWQVGRNYQLFRYMLACNAGGVYPTKFNGGLFTIDQNGFAPTQGISPDHRDWKGHVFTAQNQRLVYWPMLRNGDFEMMRPEFEFYRRITKGLEKRAEHFFGVKDGACFSEQIDVNGLSDYYGKYGVDYPLQVRHHYINAVEFAYMILMYHKTADLDIRRWIPFICSTLNFYDSFYCKKDERGRRIIFPSTAQETYHGEALTEIYGEEGRHAANYKEEETAVRNPADVIAALTDTIKELLDTEYLEDAEKERYTKFLRELPPIPTEIRNGCRVIAPCELPKTYVRGNVEVPQLNTVYPFHSFGIGKPDLKMAQDTYWYGPECEEQLSHISWHQMGIYAARLGLADKAMKYAVLKLQDSGRCFPAFWGPGHDYTPDHNWGGSGMIGVQEMLMQCIDEKIYILPSWPEEIDVSFKLWADHRTVVEVCYEDSRLTWKVTPTYREKDLVISPRFFSCRKPVICCIGDSLTEGDYGIAGQAGTANVQRENYPYFLEKELNCTVVNYGKCGFRATDYLEYYKQGHVDLRQADLVLIMLGTNGGHSTSGDSETDRAYLELIQRIRTDVPDAEVVLLTPPHTTRNPVYSNCGYADQAEIAAEFVRKTAEQERIPLIDTARNPLFCEEKEILYQTNDGLHFVKEGYFELANFISRELKKMVSYSFDIHEKTKE